LLFLVFISTLIHSAFTMENISGLKRRRGCSPRGTMIFFRCLSNSNSSNYYYYLSLDEMHWREIFHILKNGEKFNLK
jgi:hypothetical protein